MSKLPPFPGMLTKKPGRHNVMTYVLTDEQREWLCRWFPEIENSRLMEASGMSHSTLHRFARQLGLQKSERGLRGIKRRQARNVKRLLTSNGYYASLRGKRPSDACIEASRRRWEQVREGKLESPHDIMLSRNPRKYRNMMKRMGERRKELVRKERLRGFYGLERKTRLNIPYQKYTRSQVCRRHNALKRGYFFMEDCSEQGGERWNIYYDADTKRSPRFERNLEMDGFHVLEFCEN